MIIAIVVVLSTLVVSCDSTIVPSKAIVGTWELYTEANGTSTTFIIQFNEDGTGKIRDYSGTLLQAIYDITTYTLGDSSIDLTYVYYNTSKGTTETYNNQGTYKFNGKDQLNITVEGESWLPADKYYTRLR